MQGGYNPYVTIKRVPNKDYPQRISHYEDIEGKQLLEELARRRGGVSLTALLRQLTREEARRVGILSDDTAASRTVEA